MDLHVTSHAVIRYQERVENVPAEVARKALQSKTIQRAAEFGAMFVRLGSGHRVVIQDNAVVSVLPPEHYRRMICRLNLSRFGNKNRKED